MPEEIRGQGKYPRAIRELQEATFSKSSIVRTPNTLADVTTRGTVIRPTRVSKQQQGTDQSSNIPRWG